MQKIILGLGAILLILGVITAVFPRQEVNPEWTAWYENKLSWQLWKQLYEEYYHSDAYECVYALEWLEAREPPKFISIYGVENIAGILIAAAGIAVVVTAMFSVKNKQ